LKMEVSSTVLSSNFNTGCSRQEKKRRTQEGQQKCRLHRFYNQINCRKVLLTTLTEWLDMDPLV
jgi:hypothetical protein